jgi:hypothetical protein
VGLNSTFLQLGKGVHEGQLDRDPRQLHEVCNEDPVAWTKAHDINALMTHHPTQWLTPEAQKHFQSEIAPGDRFLLHLFGHMHEPVIQFYRRGGGGMKRELQGASLFGLESWETPEGHQVQRIHGYTAGRFEVEGKQGTLRLWPRKLIRLHSGEPRMAADQAQGLDEREAITDLFTERPRGDTASRANGPPGPLSARVPPSLLGLLRPLGLGTNGGGPSWDGRPANRGYPG